jgi:hypothetical protein
MQTTIIKPSRTAYSTAVPTLQFVYFPRFFGGDDWRGFVFVTRSAIRRTGFHGRITCGWRGLSIGFAGALLCAYPAAFTDSLVPHSACRQLHAIDGRSAEPSQYAPQYLSPGAAGQLQPGCAHFSIFCSAIAPDLLRGHEHTPRHTQNQSHKARHHFKQLAPCAPF